MNLPFADLVTTPGLDAEEEVPRLLAHLRTQVGGLDEREAARRLQQVGARNALRFLIEERGPDGRGAEVERENCGFGHAKQL